VEIVSGLGDLAHEILPRRQAAHRHGAAGEAAMLVAWLNTRQKRLMESEALQVLDEGADADVLQPLDDVVGARAAQRVANLLRDRHSIFHHVAPGVSPPALRAQARAL